MADHCLAAIHLCRVRATRLNADGSVKGGPNNVYVTDKPIQLVVTPVYEAGADRTLVGGCDCVVATYRGDEKLKRFDFELDLAKLEWGLFEMLTGNAAIVSGGSVIGNWFNDNAFSCEAPAQPLVALEGWQTAWDEDEQSPDWPYVHWLFPATKWALQPVTLQNDFSQPRLNGFSRGNSSWGLGPYGDLPEAAGKLGGGFYTESIPVGECGYMTQALT